MASPIRSVEDFMASSTPATMPSSPPPEVESAAPTPTRSSPMEAPTSPSLSSAKPRKQVGWAAAAPDAKPPPEPAASSSRLQRPSLGGRHHSDSTIVTERLVRVAEEPSHEQLRAEITRILTSPDAVDNGGSSPPSAVTARPKSVLRSGNATPVRAPSPPSLVVHDDDPVRAGKERSAQAAQLRASSLINDLRSGQPDDEEDSRSRSRSANPRDRSRKPTSRSRSRNRSTWFGFYHDNDSLPDLDSGQTTPDHDPDYIPPPSKYKAGALSVKLSLMQRLHHYNFPPRTPESQSRAESPSGSPRHSFAASQSSIAHLITSSGTTLSAPARPGLPRADSNPELLRPSLKHRHSSSASTTAASPFSISSLPFVKGHSRQSSFDQSQIRIHKHIQDVARRHRYLVKLCRALMAFGAPTHRLEEYMKMSSRVLEIQAQFLYMPGCMIISFDDPTMHTAEVKLVRVSQGVDLSKLWDTHAVYKDVVHDEVGVEEATARLEELLKSPDKFRTWFLVIIYGLASASVAPFAFDARYPDLAPAFVLGCILGFLRLVVSTKSVLYTDVFEIVAVAITSFLSRLFGSLPGRYFCFSALAQSSIVLILPGFHVMCAALELQSKSIVAGAVRMVYAVIFSLFLGFGVTIGTAIYGFINPDATANATCSTEHAPIRGYEVFPFVIIFSVCLMIVNQAKWKNMPVMGVIAFAGYLVNYFTSKQFAGNSQITSTLGAITISVLANLYGRLGMRFERWSRRFYRWLIRQAAARSSFVRERLNSTAKSHTESDDDDSLEKQQERQRQPSVTRRIYLAITNPKRQDEDEDEATNEDGSPRKPSTPHVRVEDSDPIPSASSSRNNSVGSDGQSSPTSKKYRASNYSLAAAAMLPGIFVLVPSGLSVGGSLVQGIQTANEIVHSTNMTDNTSSILTGGSGTNSVAFTVSYLVVQVAVGITVGLFVGSVIVYPFGKGGWKSKRMRSGLFSF